MGSKLPHRSAGISSVADTGAPGSAGASARDVLLRRELSGFALPAARAVVVVYALLAVLVYLRWLPRWLHDQAAAATGAAKLSTGAFPYTELALAAAGVAIVAALAWIALAVLVFMRRSHDLFGLLLSASFLSFGILFTNIGGIIEMERTDPGRRGRRPSSSSLTP